jgi:hypothetical protein
MQKIGKINVSPQTNNTLKLLSVISGLSMTEIIRRFALAIIPFLLDNQKGCDIQFLRVKNGVTVKFIPKGEKNE